MSEDWMDRIEKKIDGLAKKIGAAESTLRQEISGVETQLGQEISGVETRLGQDITGVEARLGQRITDVEGRLGQQITDVEGRLGQQITDVDARLGRQITDVDARLGQQITDVDARLGQQIKSVETGLRESIAVVEITVGARFDAVDLRLTRVEQEQHRQGVLIEKHSDDIRGLAESMIGLGERMDRGFTDVLTKLDDRATPLEAASRYFASKLSAAEPTPPKRPRRKKH